MLLSGNIPRDASVGIFPKLTASDMWMTQSTRKLIEHCSNILACFLIANLIWHSATAKERTDLKAEGGGIEAIEPSEALGRLLRVKHMHHRMIVQHIG